MMLYLDYSAAIERGAFCRRLCGASVSWLPPGSGLWVCGGLIRRRSAWRSPERGRFPATDETESGRAWIFHHDQARAHNGVSFLAPFKVWAYDGPAGDVR